MAADLTWFFLLEQVTFLWGRRRYLLGSRVQRSCLNLAVLPLLCRFRIHFWMQHLTFTERRTEEKDKKLTKVIWATCWEVNCWPLLFVVFPQSHFPRFPLLPKKSLAWLRLRLPSTESFSAFQLLESKQSGMLNVTIHSFRFCEVGGVFPTSSKRISLLALWNCSSLTWCMVATRVVGGSAFWGISWPGQKSHRMPGKGRAGVETGEKFSGKREKNHESWQEELGRFPR